LGHKAWSGCSFARAGDIRRTHEELTMSLIDTRIALIEAERLLSRVRNWVAKWIDRVCASNDAPIDPTAHFSLREWADLPTHHPASDE
jgi:hypothetical protein